MAYLSPGVGYSLVSMLLRLFMKGVGHDIYAETTSPPILSD